VHLAIFLSTFHPSFLLLLLLLLLPLLSLEIKLLLRVLTKTQGRDKDALNGRYANIEITWILSKARYQSKRTIAADTGTVSDTDSEQQAAILSVHKLGSRKERKIRRVLKESILPTERVTNILACDEYHQ
jgi:hypothetical protein